MGNVHLFHHLTCIAPITGQITGDHRNIPVPEALFPNHAGNTAADFLYLLPGVLGCEKADFLHRLLVNLPAEPENLPFQKIQGRGLGKPPLILSQNPLLLNLHLLPAGHITKRSNHLFAHGKQLMLCDFPMGVFPLTQRHRHPYAGAQPQQHIQQLILYRGKPGKSVQHDLATLNLLPLVDTLAQYIQNFLRGNHFILKILEKCLVQCRDIL